MSYEDYLEYRRQAMDYLSCDPPPDEPDRANSMIVKGQGWAMLALAEALRDATDVLRDAAGALGRDNDDDDLGPVTARPPR